MGVRIVGGRLARRRLEVPAGDRVRPTPDRVRESLFSALGDRLAGRSVLDLFAGSGCLGIESLSRGAARGTFVERDPRVAAVLRRNIAAVALESEAEVILGDALRTLGALARRGACFDLVWLDPPYGTGLLEEALAVLGAGELLAEGALVLAEHPTKTPPPLPAGLVEREKRAYGDTTVTVFEPVERASCGGTTGEE